MTVVMNNNSSENKKLNFSLHCCLYNIP